MARLIARCADLKGKRAHTDWAIPGVDLDKIADRRPDVSGIYRNKLCKQHCVDKNVLSLAISSLSSCNAATNNEKFNKSDVQSMILAAALPFVSQYGWTKQAISAGAEVIGYPSVAHGLFPRGSSELVHYFYESCNQQLVEQLKKETEEAYADSSQQKEPEKFARDAIETRLRMITPYLSKWPQALGIMSHPTNVPTSLANLLTLVDDICYYSGDRSVNFSWYTHRITLAGIYKTTELCFIQDQSEDYQETWQFLAQRIEDAVMLRQYLHQSEKTSNIAKDVVTAAFITARNILGLSLGNR